jgi:hypothetical protein
MSYTQFPLSEHHAMLLAALPGRSPSINSKGDEDVILNQQGGPPPFPEPPLLSRGAGATSSSQQNLDPSIFFGTFSNVFQHQLQQQQHNQQLYGMIERLTKKLDLVSGHSISARDLLESQLRAPRPTKDGKPKQILSNGITSDDDDEDELATRFVDHTFYRHKIGEGFVQRQPSELAAAKPAYFNIDDQVTRTLCEVKTSARRAENTATVTNAFFT